MNETVRQAIAFGLGVAFVVWQADKSPGRALAATLAAAAVLYAVAPVVRDGVAG